MSRFRRENDNVDELLAETHETVGRMHALLDDLSEHITDLEKQINRPEKGAR
jgi:hypothetical protein